MTSSIPVLLYHSVADTPAPGDAWGAVSRAEFRAHVEAIRDSGRVPLCITALAEALRGERDRRVRAAVIDAGYRSAAAVKNAVSHPYDDPFAIARWTVTGGASAARLAEVLEGEGVPRARERERIRTRAYRSVRRRRRRL